MRILGVFNYGSQKEHSSGQRKAGLDSHWNNRAVTVVMHRPLAHGFGLPVSISAILGARYDQMISRQMDRNSAPMILRRWTSPAGSDSVVVMASQVKRARLGDGQVFVGARHFVFKDHFAVPSPDFPWYRNEKKIAAIAAGVIGFVGGAVLAYHLMDHQGICPWTHTGLRSPVSWERPLLSNTGIDDRLSHWSISRSEANKNFLKYLPLNNAFFWNGFLGTCSSVSAPSGRQFISQDTDVCPAVPDRVDVDAANIDQTIERIEVVEEVPVSPELKSPEKTIVVEPEPLKEEKVIQKEAMSKADKKLQEKEEKRLRKEEKRLLEEGKKEAKRLRKAEKEHQKTLKKAKKA